MERSPSLPAGGSSSAPTHHVPDSPAVQASATEDSIAAVTDAPRRLSLLDSPSRSTGSSSGLRNIASRFRRDASVPEQQPIDLRGPLGLNTLFEPNGSECIVDIVFIHGLNGGSRKTWCASPSEEESFWPKNWLPFDHDFDGARIHTYGYDSEWGKRKRSILNIHDFGQSLLTVLKNHPLIRRSRTRIILVGHSMGGCVAKETYILACENPAYQQLASRFHSIFFLGTPHRGANLAVILRNILQVAWGTKPYVEDLAPDSAVLTKMNDIFREYANRVYLFSFFETLPMPGLNKVVVDKHSAMLGFGNEEVSFMDADHRNVCKFQGRNDPNYQKLRNALSNAVDNIKDEAETSIIEHEPLDNQSKVSKLAKYLSITDIDSLEDDLAMLEEFKIPGSCSWFTDLTPFQSWIRREATSPPILLLTGRPGVGKSILCGHVMDLLKNSGSRRSNYIFKHGKAGTRNLSSLLTSMAFQMALQDLDVLRCLLRLKDEGVSWEPHDERSIWKKVFLSAVFRLDSIATHFWVIDGLDECLKFGNLFKLMSQLPDGLRIFITTRSVPEIERGVSTLGRRVFVHAMTSLDTLDDMRLYVRSKLEEISHPDTESLAERILGKANGSFLWARLVIQDLETSYTDEDIDSVLSDVPEDLSAVYGRILQTIENDKRRAKLAKSILTWITLAARPLTVTELQYAIKLDLKDTLQLVEHVIITTCGQFVFIDQSARVQLIHETARAFLLSEDLDSRLAVRGPLGHAQLALLSLGYLKNTFKPHHAAKSGKAKTTAVSETAFLQYAATYFSDHILKATSEDLTILAELRKFLDWTVLSWIEFYAKAGDLSPVTQTAINLGGYLDRVTKHILPTDSNFQVVESWVTDMIRVCARFRKHLLTCPSSIHLLVPGYCPTNSAISQRFSAVSPALVIRGLREPNWDDCLMRVDYQTGMATALGHGERYFAVGRSNGELSIYDMVSLQKNTTLQHPGRISCLEFAPEDKFVASSSKDILVIWDPRSSTELYRFSSSQALALSFTADMNLLLASKLNQIISIDIPSGQITKISLAEANNYSSIIPSQLPTRATFSSGDYEMFALFYRSHPVLVFDTSSGHLLGQCSVGWNNGVNAMVFNPSPEISALIVAYTDGNLVVYDTRTFKSTFMTRHIYAHALACSSDGRSLLAGSNNGVIEKYEFAGAEGNTLELIHRINSKEPDIRGMAFSSDGLRFVNICPDKCRVWEPAALVRRDAEWLTQSGLSAEAPLPPRASSTIGMMEVSAKPEITSLVSIPAQDLIICGRNNGDVVLYSTENGNELEILYSHSKGVSVISVVARAPEGIVATADDSGRVLVAKMTETLPRWSKASVSLDRRFGNAVNDIVLAPSCDYLLVSGGEDDEVWDLSNGEVVGRLGWEDSHSRTVLEHPQDPNSFMVIHKQAIQALRWSGLTNDIETRTYRPGTTDRFAAGPISKSFTYKINERWLVEASIARGDQRAARLRYWDISQLQLHGNSLGSSSNEVEDGLNSMIRSIIALTGSTLFFLDINQWVCSVDLDVSDSTKLARRHFFILPEWLDGNGKLLCSMTSKSEFVFAYKDGLTIIEGGLEFVEHVGAMGDGTWKVISGGMHRRMLGPTSATIVPRPGIESRTYSANLRSDFEVGARQN